MHDLEEHAGLNRAVEFLPTDEELDIRLETTGDRLTRPELSVLAAYVKIYLTHALEQTDFADDPYLEGVLRSYSRQHWSSASVSTWIRTRCVRKSSAPASLTSWSTSAVSPSHTA